MLVMPLSDPRVLLQRSLVVISIAAGLAGGLVACGVGNGTSTFLPPGPPTNAAAGDLVLYVAMAQGDRVDAYRLGTDGLLPSNPFDTIFVENPRRLAIDDGVLHVALRDSVISLAIAADGSLPDVPSSQSLITKSYDPQEIVARDGVLYVAASGLGRVESYRLDDENLVPVAPTGSGTSGRPLDYASLELVDDFLYSGSRQQGLIDVFLLNQDGDVPLFAEDVDPQDQIALPDDMFERDGILYVTSGSDKAIRAYIIRQDGTLPTRENSRTETEEFYSRIMIDGDLLYASAYNAGRIDVYRMEANGMLVKDGPIFETEGDPASYPIRAILHGGIIYVAQAGLDRVDAYVIDQEGLPTRFPSSSTDPFDGGPSFPADLVMHELN